MIKTSVKEHIIDADGKVLGRLAVQVANLLRGKSKPGFAPHLDQGDSVVVFNTDKIVLTGRKMSQKNYFSYSGYPGGLKRKRISAAFKNDSRDVLRKAVWGMLPNNKLRNQFIKKLKMCQKEKNYAS